jgi:hypothetical protein
MKPKKTEKKLTIKKQSIANLNAIELKNAKGGTNISFSCKLCTKDCTVPFPYCILSVMDILCYPEP